MRKGSAGTKDLPVIPVSVLLVSHNKLTLHHGGASRLAAPTPAPNLASMQPFPWGGQAEPSPHSRAPIWGPSQAVFRLKGATEGSVPVFGRVVHALSGNPL